MKTTIITADDVRRAYDAMQTAEKACHRAIYGGSSERRVEYLKREIEYEYKSDALEWPNDSPVCNRPAAHFTAEQIDAEITAYYTAMKSIDAMRDRYIAECAAIISQFGAISTRDLDRRAKVDDYDIRKVA